MVFYLGAKDPEMDRIEEILTQKEIEFKYATVKDMRVHPGNAYVFDGNETEFNKNAVFIECFPLILKGQEQKFHRIDHHRPCDEGFHMSPSSFWEASSIGQLYKTLSINNGALYNDLILAAMDHCLPEALNGLLPGIHTKDVLNRRIFEISKANNLTIEEIHQKIQNYKTTILSLPIKRINGVELYDLRKVHLGYGYNSELLSAQTAASILGVSILLKHGDIPGKEKVTLSGVNSSDNVISIQEYLKSQGLQNIYAVPLRGYCGGYF